MDGYVSSPIPTSDILPVPKGVPRKTEVILMGMFYKNNLLNQSLWNLDKVPSPLCAACSQQEETPAHILFECSAVNVELRTLSKRHYNRVNNRFGEDALDPYIGLLNARSDKDFIIVCINIINSLRLRESIVL